MASSIPALYFLIIVTGVILLYILYRLCIFCLFLGEALCQHLVDIESGGLFDTVGDLGHGGHDIACQLAGIAAEHLDGIYVHVALSHSLCDLGQLLEVYLQSI